MNLLPTIAVIVTFALLWTANNLGKREHKLLDKVFSLYEMEKGRYSFWSRRYYQGNVHSIIEKYLLKVGAYQGEDIVPEDYLEEELTNFVFKSSQEAYNYKFPKKTLDPKEIKL